MSNLRSLLGNYNSLASFVALLTQNVEDANLIKELKKLSLMVLHIWHGRRFFLRCASQNNTAGIEVLEGFWPITLLF